jgi:two-component system, LuxR family, sensor kinase FixL
MTHEKESSHSAGDPLQRAEAFLGQSPADAARPSVEDIQSLISDLLADRLKLERQIEARAAELASAKRQLNEANDQVQRVKQALRTREKKLDAIVDSAVDGIVTIDESGQVTTFNAAAEKIFDYSEEEMLGRNISVLMSPPHRDRHNDYINRYLETGESAIIGIGRELEGRRKDGSVLPLQLSVTEFTIGRTRYFTGIIRDLTDQKRNEREQRARLDELSHVSRLCLMGEMASGLAHELNQPLTAIASYLQACQRLIDAGNLEKLKPALNSAERQALLAGEIIRRMRAFVSKRKTVIAPTNINALIKEAVGLCEANCRQNSVLLDLELVEPLPDVCVDSVQIEQVLLNLIRNSIEAMAEMPADADRRLLIETGSREENQVQIQVTLKDTGPGLAADQVAHIFKPFHTTKPKGMGMGLSISRSIIEAHGGRLWVDADPPGGAAFHFTLPIADACDKYE